MPRYKGASRNLKNRIELLLDDLRLARANAIARALGMTRTDAIRRAIDDEYISLLSSGSIDLTIAPIERGAAEHV